MFNFLFAIAAILVASNCRGAERWDGHFKWGVVRENGNIHENIVDISCDDGLTCNARTSVRSNGKEIKQEPLSNGSDPTPIKTDGPFELDEETASLYRKVVSQLANIDDFPHAPSYFRTTIYRQIGLPRHILDCRVRKQDSLVICRLDEPRILDDLGSRTSFILFSPDFSSGARCPGYGCPEPLTKE